MDQCAFKQENRTSLICGKSVLSSGIRSIVPRSSNPSNINITRHSSHSSHRSLANSASHLTLVVHDVLQVIQLESLNLRLGLGRYAPYYPGRNMHMVIVETFPIYICAGLAIQGHGYSGASYSLLLNGKQLTTTYLFRLIVIGLFAFVDRIRPRPRSRSRGGVGIIAYRAGDTFPTPRYTYTLAVEASLGTQNSEFGILNAAQ